MGLASSASPPRNDSDNDDVTDDDIYAPRTLETLLPLLPKRIRKIPVQREHRILRRRIDPEMNGLHRFAPRSDSLERLLELCRVLHLDHQVKVAETRHAEAELRQLLTPDAITAAIGTAMPSARR
jgi:hypothetical protein